MWGFETYAYNFKSFVDPLYTDLEQPGIPWHLRATEQSSQRNEHGNMLLGGRFLPSTQLQPQPDHDLATQSVVV